jgi:superfamily II DNA helicase RecQ
MEQGVERTLVQQPLEALKRHFGHEGFLDGQERVVSEIVSGRDGLVVMPTGGASRCATSFRRCASRG